MNQLESEIYGIASNEQIQFTKELSIHLIEYEPWWQAIGIQELQKTIEKRIIHFEYPKVHLVSQYQSQFGERVLVPNSPGIFLNGYISAM